MHNTFVGSKFCSWLSLDIHMYGSTVYMPYITAGELEHAQTKHIIYVHTCVATAVVYDKSLLTYNCTC